MHVHDCCDDLGFERKCPDPFQSYQVRHGRTAKGLLGGFHKLSVSPADFSELAALDDRFDRRGETVIVRREPLLHLGQQRLVGKLNAAAQRIAEKLAAELVDKGVAASHAEVVSQACQAVDLLSVGKLRLGVDGAAAEIVVRRRRPIASKPSSAKPNGSNFRWHDEQRMSLTCRSTS